MSANTRLPDTFLITSIDPGPTTGMSLVQVTPHTVAVVYQRAEPYDPDNKLTPVDTITSWAHDHFGTPHVLLYEAFRIRPGQRSIDPRPLEVIGAIRDRLLVHGSSPYTRIVVQEPVEKSDGNKRGKLVTDAVLNRLGLLAYGKDSVHINDTFRHVVSYLTRRCHPWICETGWPRENTPPAPTAIPEQR